MFSSISAVFLKISHGYRIDRIHPDPLNTLVQRSAHEFHIAAQPGKWLVDLCPWSKYNRSALQLQYSTLRSVADLPGWLPGTSFKRVASEFRLTLDTIMAVPLKFVQEQLVRYCIQS